MEPTQNPVPPEANKTPAPTPQAPDPQIPPQAQPVPQAPVAKPNITLDQLITLAIEKEASDIHFGEGSRIALRVEGQFVYIENVEELSKAEAEQMVKELIKNEEELKRLERVKEVDFSYLHSSGVSFRVNVFYSRGRLSAVLRMISKHLPTMQELGIPDVMKRFLELREGLILITGTAGSGKSTSIQAMLEHVNENFVYHIITIENPIEHIFTDKKSIFSQREIGKDTLTYTNALHSATREDPNIIMVSDIADRETLDAVLDLVEMGHLVVGSMATKNVRQTIEHMISLYPHDEQEQLQDRLSSALSVILSQDLLDRIDQKGRVAVYEVCICNSAIANIIKHGNLGQLRTTMENAANEGMVTMDAYAYQLAERGVIDKEDVNQYNDQD